MAKGDDIQERLINFAVFIINICSLLPDSQSGKHISGKLLRCGTSPASNYGETRGAESKNDFVNKLGIVLKELNESAIWLDMIIRADLLKIESIDQTIRECYELSKITAYSIRTVGKKRNN